MIYPLPSISIASACYFGTLAKLGQVMGVVLMRIVICDQQRMLAEALAYGLDARGYHVLAVEATVSDVLSTVDAGRPDVCLLGWPPGEQSSDLDAVHAIRQRYPGMKVLVLSKRTDPETLSQLVKSPVAGLTHQDQSVDQIASALDAIAADQNVLDPGPRRIPVHRTERLSDLSPREKEVLARIVRGQSTTQMALAMNITVDTVRTYVKNVLAKLGAHSRLQLAALASQDGSHRPGTGHRRPVYRGPADEPVPAQIATRETEQKPGGRVVIRPAPLAPPRIDVLIVDQRFAFRDALAARLQAEPDLAVVAKVHSAAFVPRVLVGRSAHVILLDAELPDDSAIAFCAEMARRVAAPRVIMLSAASQPERIVAAVRAGAVAWVRKDESIDHLLGVIRDVADGETRLPPTELGPVLRLLIQDQDNRRHCDDLLAGLTPRERDVLFHLVDGAGRKEVAERLHLSANTVRTYMNSLMTKLGVHSTLEVVALTRPRLEALPEMRHLRGPTTRDAGAPQRLDARDIT